MTFADRTEAGKLLAKKLSPHANDPHTLVIALPRGGVVVAFEIAQALHLPLDVVSPRKIGAPGNPEFAIGAVDEEGYGVFHEEIIAQYEISDEYIARIVETEKEEAARRLKLYRAGHPALDVQKKTVILVDDGIATGATIKTAIQSVKSKGAKKVIVAVPVTARDSLAEIQKRVDGVVFLEAPFFFGAVGAFYERFDQTLDMEVIELMRITNEDFQKKNARKK